MYHVFRFAMATDNTVNSVYREDVPGIDEDDLEFMDGARLGALPLLRFIQPAQDRGILLDYVPSVPPSMVISSRLRSAFISAGVDNADYYPAEIVDAANGQVHRGYYAMNILGKIACVDLSMSKFVPMPGYPNKVIEFEEMHLDYSVVHGAKLFRLHEKPGVIVVSDHVKSAIEVAGLRGMKLVPAEGFAGL